MRRIVPLIGLLILVFVPLSAVNAVNPPGSLDVGFDADDGPDGTVQAVVLQSDGRILIAGNFTHVDGWGYEYAARLNANGGLDHAFNTAVDINNAVYSMDVQLDGKVLIGGVFDTVGGIQRHYLARLNPDGTLDQSFDPGSWLNGAVTSIVVQPDGKVLIAGNFYDFTDGNSYQWGHIARLNSDGTVDSSFDPGDGANSFIDDIALMSDGKIVIGGNFSNYDGSVRKYVARIHPDGSLDEAFDPGAGPDGQVQSVAVDNQDRVLIGGLFSEVAVYERYSIARLDSSGYVDTSFDPKNGLDNSVTDIDNQADDKILLVGNFASVDLVPQRGIARLDSLGDRDASFDPGVGTNDSIRDMALYPNGQILIGGDFTTYRGYIRKRVARVNYDGSLDRGLYTSPGPNNTVYSLARQPDGRILIGGDFSQVVPISRNGIARLNTDGILDTSFDPLQGVDGFVSKIALLPDGKILIGGSFTTYALYDCANIALLEQDGALVTSFCDNADTNGQVKDIVIQPDGKILIAGKFTEVNGQPRVHIARLNQNGSLDSTFDTVQLNAALGIESIALRDDGVMYVGGTFQVNLDGVLSFANLARLNTDGSVDRSYDPSDGPDYIVRDVALDPYGKVYIGGMFSHVGDVPRKYIARLNADGSLDEAFDPGTGPDAPVNVLAVVDGFPSVVIIGGEFQAVDGVERNYLARLIDWGAVDTMFNTVFSTDPDSGFNSPVHDILPVGDGRIYVSGSFYLVGDAYRFYAASLHAGTQPGLRQVNFSVKSVGDDYISAPLAYGYPKPVINIISGNLPPGLVLDSPTGVISGTLEAAGIFSFTVTASNYISPNDTQTYKMPVTKGETITTITSHEPQPVYVGQAVRVSYDVASTVGTPSGQVTVTEGLVSCTGTVSQGSCDMVFGWPGPMVLMAKYSGDDNFEPSISQTIVHNVYAAIFLPQVSR